MQLNRRQRNWLSIEACAAISTPAFLIVPLIHVSQFQSPIQNINHLNDPQVCAAEDCSFDIVIPKSRFATSTGRRV